MSEDLTAVIFRVYKEGDILAIFPEIPGDNNPATCMCYQHLGQHGHADYYGMIRSTRPCSPAQSEALAKELESIGYKLKPYRRATPQHHQTRKAELKRQDEQVRKQTG